MQSLRIIQKCDHIKRTEVEIMEVTQLYRQEVRESVVLPPTSEKLSFHGDWIENKNNEGKIVSKTNSDENGRCAVFFYGDDATIYASASDFNGPVYVYLDRQLIDTVTEVKNANSKKEFPVVSVAELEYGPHVVELSFTQNFEPASIDMYSEKNISMQAKKTMTITNAYCSEILIDDLSDSDIISPKDIIKKILKVSQGEEGKEGYMEFEEHLDYELFDGNRIRWIGQNRPKAHVPYIVEYSRLEISYKTYLPDECEKCYGLDWYGCLQNLTTKQPSRATGVDRITEDIIKFILTPYNEDTGYGSEFLNLLKRNYIQLDDLETYAVSEIERITNAYKALQTNEILKGASYEATDILDTIEVDKVSFDVGTLRLSLALTVVNQKGQEVIVEEAFEL